MEQFTRADLIHAWNMYAKYNQPHPCKMPSPKAEAGRLLIVYGDRALKIAVRQVKPGLYSSQVIYYLDALGLPAR